MADAAEARSSYESKFSAKILINLTPELKTRIDAAAGVVGKSTAEFLRNAAMRDVAEVEEREYQRKSRREELRRGKRENTPAKPELTYQRRHTSRASSVPDPPPPPSSPLASAPTVVVNTGSASGSLSDDVARLATWICAASDTFERARREGTAEQILRATAEGDALTDVARRLDEAVALGDSKKRSAEKKSGWSWLSGGGK